MEGTRRACLSHGESRRSSPESPRPTLFTSLRLTGFLNPGFSPLLFLTQLDTRSSLAHLFLASMGNIGEPTTPAAESTFPQATMEIVNHSIAPHTKATAAGGQVACDTAKNSTPAPTDASSAPDAEREAALPPQPRLIDSDPSKFRSLKRVIVIGRPGSGTDGECGTVRNPR